MRSIDGYVAAAVGVLLIAGAVLSFVLAPGAGGGWGIGLRTLLPLGGRLHPRRPVHVAAQRSGDPEALRPLRRHRPHRGPALGQPVLCETQDQPARAQPQHGDAQSQRQARQPDGDRRGRGVARRRHGAAVFDVEDYENYVKVQAESALRHLATQLRLRRRRRPGATASPRCARARSASAALQDRAAAALRRRPAWSSKTPGYASGVCARDRAGDAAPSAGRSDHRARSKIVQGAVSMVEDGARRGWRASRRSSTTSARQRW